ncbi:hypothetical protein K7X08_034135 [Anisodus acutangulus]|uniref:Uncharacterized protein n=1 Tax=Anisodus acutangulus TaxID=402998 RepID=A0A9Q1M2M9_9SOLA|nr:hypothetical protein K7X08_034135 [Anisodus acutangulus]
MKYRNQMKSPMTSIRVNLKKMNQQESFDHSESGNGEETSQREETSIEDVKRAKEKNLWQLVYPFGPSISDHADVI